MSNSYDFNALEAKWQAYWDEQQTFRAANPGTPGSERPKFYVLDFFPYPSGAGLHVGHPLGYIASDIMARFMRMRGYNVLHPMGWDAFGLPAEQYAIETGVHPRITTQRNIETYKRQLRTVGLSYDWQREIATCDPAYYRWTQWIFSKIFNAWYDPEYRWTDAAGRSVVGRARPIRDLPIPPEVKAHGEREIEAFRNEHRLAFVAEVPVNWCPALGTVLANEEVTNDGRSDRGNHPVYRRPLRQWMLRITEYADRLLADLEELDWPEPIKLMQRNWIGRSEGAYVDFTLDGTGPASGEIIRVFTTRPDTLFGATYMVLAPEHSLVPIITTDEHRETVRAYVDQARQKTELDRTADAKKKTGVFTGAYAINPVNRQRVPIWVADYVLMGYGTGSIMAVPAHDTRDLEFAQTFGLPVVQVVQPPQGQDWRGFVDDGVSVNSPAPDAPTFPGQCSLNGLPTPEAKRKITQWLEERDLGEGTIQYKLRDWLFSRQRYWGEPFPILFREDGTAVSVPEEELPIALPDMDDFKPLSSDDPNAEPQTPLARAAHWVTVERDGQKLRRETNTMPQWAGSCWYYLRFCDPQNAHAMIDRDVERYWLGGTGADGRPKVGGVDLYMGGAEHAVLHLLYARFWHKVLYDLGYVSTPEPFHKLFNQGMIGAAAYRTERGVYVPAAEVTEGAETEMLHPDERKPIRTRFAYQGQPVMQAFEKMSKSLKNVVNPDDIIRQYGADTLRLYEMYMGPLEKSKPWNTADIIGVHRFLQRVWRLVVGDAGEAAPPLASGQQSGAGSASTAAAAPRPSGSGPAAPQAGSGGVAPAGAAASAPRPQGASAAADRPSSAAVPTLNPKIVAQRDADLERLLHKTIKKVTADIATFGYNTAIAQLIVWSNEAAKAPSVGRDQVERFVLLLAPFAPHIAEELWQRLGHTESLAYAPWPQHEEALTRDDTLELPVQVNGKLRGRITVAADATDEEILAAAEAHTNVAREIAGKTLKRRLVVKGRLVNLIV